MKCLNTNRSSLDRYRNSLIVLALLAVTSAGCNKSERDLDSETLSSREHAMTMLIFDGLFKEVHQFALSDSITNTTGFVFDDNNCIASARFNKSRADFPVVLTMVYDSSECNDEVVRKGQIIIEFSGKYLDEGTQANVSLKGFSVNGKSVEGSMEVKNLGLSSGRWNFSTKVKNGMVTSFNTLVFWEGTMNYAWTEGDESQGDIEDDVFHIEHEASGRNSRGSSYSVNSTANIVSDSDCKWFATGREKMRVANLVDRNINYGEGDCENAMTVRRNNTYFEVDIDY